MAATYEPIATTTLGSATASFDFTSIPATYTDLKLVIIPIASGASDYNLYVRFNADSGTNYSRTGLYGDGSTAGSWRNTNQAQMDDVYIYGYKTTPSLTIYNIFSYAGSTYKTCLVESARDYNGTGTVYRSVQLWRSTSAINQITVLNAGAATFASGTTATLYGILKA